MILGQDDQTPVGSTPNGWIPALYVDTNGKLRANFFWFGTTGHQIVTANSYNDNNWHQAVDVYSDTIETLYVDGSPVGSQAHWEFAYSGAYSYTLGTGFTQYWGQANSTWFSLDGLLDEARVSNAARSPAWIQTEFTNQQAPASFVVVGPSQSAP